MKNRRDFLKFFGIGATVAAGALLARTGGNGPATPPTSPRTLQAVEDTVKRPIEYLEPELNYEIKSDWIKGSPLPGAPDVMELQRISNELHNQMVDNVMHQSPMFQYLTTNRAWTTTADVNVSDAPIVTWTDAAVE